MTHTFLKVELLLPVRGLTSPSGSPQVLPRGRSPPPSCPTRTTSPGRRTTAASCVSTEARGRNCAAWWSSTTPCTRGRSLSTSRWPCRSAGAWDCTTTPPRSTSWRTRTTVSPAERCSRNCRAKRMFTDVESMVKVHQKISLHCADKWGFILADSLDSVLYF